MIGSRRARMPDRDIALPGRDRRPFVVPPTHAVLGTPLEGDIPTSHQVAYFGLGCFWGAEADFWQTPGVWSTAVGYAGGFTPNPTYDEVCTGQTGHAEVVRVVFDPSVVSYDELLRVFWESHDPTQGYRQGNDVGTQYRSILLVANDAQQETAQRSRAAYQQVLTDAGYGAITTQVVPAEQFYYAEDYHQQYLARNTHGYRCHASTGVRFPREALAEG